MACDEAMMFSDGRQPSLLARGMTAEAVRLVRTEFVERGNGRPGTRIPPYRLLFSHELLAGCEQSIVDNVCQYFFIFDDRSVFMSKL
ncbi:hypothetical protein BA190_18780 [Labrys sp. WJW]|nr:hypothetical protein BA190_18780 [Labrys sp. WJW]